MGRPKSVTTVSLDSDIENKVDTVETVENTEVKEEVKSVENTEKKETSKKGKKEEGFSETDTVVIKNTKYINKSVVGLNGLISFNGEGICSVNGIEAKRLLTIPGYTFVKKE